MAINDLSPCFKMEREARALLKDTIFYLLSQDKTELSLFRRISDFLEEGEAKWWLEAEQQEQEQEQ